MGNVEIKSAFYLSNVGKGEIKIALIENIIE
jgi:hypothetical protein